MEGHRGTGDDFCCPDPDLMLGRHCMPVSLKWCFPLPCHLPVADKRCHVSLASLKEIFLLCSKDRRPPLTVVYLLDPEPAPHTQLEFISLLLYTQSGWFLPVPWGNRICCPFPHNLEIVYMNEIVPNLHHENLAEVHGA